MQHCIIIIIKKEFNADKWKSFNNVKTFFNNINAILCYISKFNNIYKNNIDKDPLTIIRRTYRYKVCKVLTKIYRVTIFSPTKRQCRCAHLLPKKNEQYVLSMFLHNFFRTKIILFFYFPTNIKIMYNCLIL